MRLNKKAIPIPAGMRRRAKAEPNFSANVAEHESTTTRTPAVAGKYSEQLSTLFASSCKHAVAS